MNKSCDWIANRPVKTGKPFIFSVFLFCFLALLLPASASALGKKHPPKINDLRVLVDISGSMKKTDPQNLRRPAIRLLAGLIPAGSRAGVWNFGRQVNMAVKIGKVDQAWRELARRESEKISSVGLYTNIEDALRKASFDWNSPDPRYRRNLLLLTDGHVDISEAEAKDKASRQRIIREILPRLEKAGVRIHTIALSDNVDESLLSTLSSYTDGVYTQVSHADELQKVFMQILQQSIPMDTLPITDNVFKVDKGIHDMTLLVFNNSKQPTRIATPDSQNWQEKTHPKTVSWYRDRGFDLITVNQPKAGQWKIQAPLDKSNRVVVATNLKLKVGELPAFLIQGDSLQVSAWLSQDNKPLSDKRLLDKFRFSLERDAKRSSERNYPLHKTEKDDYSFAIDITPVFNIGNNEVIIRAKSPTVEREVRHQFRVYDTAAEIKLSKEQSHYTLKVTPLLNVLRPESVNMFIVMNDGRQIPLQRLANSWVTTVDNHYADTFFTLKLNAIRADNKPASYEFKRKLALEGASSPLTVGSHEAAEVKHEPVKKKHAAEQSQGHEKKQEHNKQEVKKEDKKQAHEKEAEHEPEQEEELDWTLITVAIIFANLVLALIVVVVVILIRRRKQKLQQSLDDDLDAPTEKEEGNKDG